MLLFSTILDINKSMTKDKFIELVINWNQGSPHEDNIIPNIKWNGERNIRYSHEDKLWLDIEEYRNENIIAVRYEKKLEDGVIWDTDYVMNFKLMKMSIRLDRSFTDEAIEINRRFSTPHFITLLIEEGYLESDKNIAIIREPILVNEENLDILVFAINKEIDYNLPIIYVSKTQVNENPVDVKWLSSRLKGVAHVLVQENMELNQILQEKCNSKNEYFGAVGIYYPTEAVPHKRFLYKKYYNSDTFLNRIVNYVIQFSNAQMIDTLFTWQGVKNALLRDRFKSQKEKSQVALANAKEDTEDILDEFEILEQKVKELTEANELLTYENQGLKSKIDSQSGAQLLYTGDEEELYSGEIKDFILSALNNELFRLDKNTRRYEVIDDIIQNNHYQKISESKKNKLKTLLKNYDGMSKKLRQELQKLGFKITDDGKHYKLVYYEDNRYTFTIAKTPSDSRAGKNNVSIISKKVF